MFNGCTVKVQPGQQAVRQSSGSVSGVTLQSPRSARVEGPHAATDQQADNEQNRWFSEPGAASAGCHPLAET